METECGAQRWGVGPSFYSCRRKWVDLARRARATSPGGVCWKCGTRRGAEMAPQTRWGCLRQEVGTGRCQMVGVRKSTDGLGSGVKPKDRKNGKMMQCSSWFEAHCKETTSNFIIDRKRPGPRFGRDGLVLLYLPHTPPVLDPASGQSDRRGSAHPCPP
jgi:hypothetical protein